MKKKILSALLALLSFYLLTAQELYQIPPNTESRMSSFENLNGEKGHGGLANRGAKGHAFEGLKAGETKTLLDIRAGGVIRRIWCTVDDRSPAMLRSLRLRMYWDGSSKPAVDVPLGDFFGAGLGRPVAFESALLTNPEGRSFNCYIPMPFKTSARITLTNESASNLQELFFDVDYTTAPAPQADVFYFHACWNRLLHTSPGKDFDLLPPVQGRGRYLGVCVGVNVDPVYGDTWWGEGEVKMFIDGDGAHPTINGTGTEDYIGTGFGEGPFHHQYQGCTVADAKSQQYVFYRFHIPDPIYFHTRFRCAIQEVGGGDVKQVLQLQQAGVALTPVTVSGDHFTTLLDGPAHPPLDSLKGWMNFYRTDDYSATAYFYLDRPFSNLPAMAPVGDRVRLNH